jgi:glutaconate CoA-transferase subunit B
MMGLNHMTLDNSLRWSSDEIMTIAASRTLQNGQTCFVGVGIPSTAAILAKSTTAPDLILLYESGTFDTNPRNLPLSIGDGELAESALMVVSMPEIFNYWLQSRRVDLGFLGAAQIDKFANLNTTFVGNTYESPTVRLPGAGGASEIAAECAQTTVIVKQNLRTFVDKIDFITSVGFGDKLSYRQENGLRGKGVTKVITDIGILEPDSQSCELILTHLHPDTTVGQAVENTGWELKVAENLKIVPAPTEEELQRVRALVATSDKN